MRKMSELDWRAAGAGRFGPEWRQWDFICPCCNHVQHGAHEVGKLIKHAYAHCESCGHEPGDETQTYVVITDHLNRTIEHLVPVFEFGEGSSF